jgi:hypothetical protein
VELDRVASFGLDDAEVVLKGGSGGSAAESVAAAGGVNCGNGGAMGAFTRGTMLGGTLFVGSLLLGNLLLGTLFVGTLSVGTMTGGTLVAGTSSGTVFGAVSLRGTLAAGAFAVAVGTTQFAGTALVMPGEGSGALGRGT